MWLPHILHPFRSRTSLSVPFRCWPESGRGVQADIEPAPARAQILVQNFTAKLSYISLELLLDSAAFQKLRLDHQNFLRLFYAGRSCLPLRFLHRRLVAVNEGAWVVADLGPSGCFRLCHVAAYLFAAVYRLQAISSFGNEPWSMSPMRLASTSIFNAQAQAHDLRSYHTKYFPCWVKGRNALTQSTPATCFGDILRITQDRTNAFTC